MSIASVYIYIKVIEKSTIVISIASGTFCEAIYLVGMFSLISVIIGIVYYNLYYRSVIVP